MTAFGPNPYGQGALLHLWEQTGDSGLFTIQLPAGMRARAARLCDLRGQPIGAPFAISDKGTFNLTIKPLAPVSVILVRP